MRIGGADSWPANVGQQFLGNERLVFCASPAYLARKGSPRSIEDLSSHETVTYGRSDGTPSPWLVRQDPAPVERRTMESRLVLGNAEAQLEAVVAGHGVAQLATWLADDALASGQLVRILPDCSVDGLPLRLAWPQSKQLLPKVDALRNHLASNLQVR